MTTLSVPQVNLNGTSRSELQRQYFEARQALAVAITKLQDACPHGRDYQTLPDSTARYATARDQHVWRLETLRTIASELTSLYYSVQT